MSNQEKNNAFLLLSTIIALIIISALYYYKPTFQNNSIFGDLMKKKTGVIITSYNIPIITYHYVEVVTDEKDFIRKSLAITPATLEKQLQIIKEKGYETIFVSQIPEILNSAADTQKKYIDLTFDDGYRDFYTNVFPLLKKYNVKATTYIMPNFIGGANWMTKQQLSEVSSSGLVEIGAHTMNHMQLPSIPAEQAKNEIVQSKDVLEKMFNIKVKTFAYPSGFYNESILKMVREDGFTNAVSDEKGTTQSLGNLFHLNRVRVGSFDFDAELK